MYNPKLILVSFFLMVFCTVNGQITFEKRIESNNSDGFEYEEIFEFGELGLIKKSRSEKSKSGMNKWRFDLLDKNLEIAAFANISLDNKFQQDEVYLGEDKFHILFKGKKTLKLVSIDVLTMEETEVEFELPKKVNISEFCVLDNIAVFSAYLKSAPYLFSVNWKSGKQQYIPIKMGSIKSKDISIQNMQVLEEESEILVFVKSTLRKAQDVLSVIRLDIDARVIETFDFSEGLDRNIVTISGSKIGPDKFIFTGTYSNAMSYSSEGIFYAVKDGEELKYINYHKFLDLENFLSYMSDRKLEKLEKKKKRKEDRGKELHVNYLMAMHDVIRLNDGFAVIGEAYYPTYRTETQTTYINGRPTTTTTQVFDGYFYTHALVAKFDLDGNLVWDRTFELRPNQKPFYAKLFISLMENSSNSIDMLFVSGNSVVNKSIAYDGEVLTERSSEIMESMYEEDKVLYSKSEISYWYDNYFINFGKQKIKNKEEDDVKKKRTVFYLSKIRYDP